MARGYHHRNSRSSFILHLSRPVRDIIRRSSFGLIIFLAIVLILTGKSENAKVLSVRAKVMDVLTPALQLVVVPIDAMRDSKDNLKTYLFVHDKNKQLEEDNKKLRVQVTRLYQVQKENDKLQDLLNYIKEMDYKYISAKVVGNASGPFTRSALVNAGEKDAVLKGQAVVTNGGLVGRIVEVGNRSSRALLLTDINSKIPVISLDSRERSVLSGNNADSPKLIYLPKESKITDGEVIITSGDGDIFPAGLMVGRASKLNDGSFEVIPFVNWHNIEYVSILGMKEETE